MIATTAIEWGPKRVPFVPGTFPLSFPLCNGFAVTAQRVVPFGPGQSHTHSLTVSPLPLAIRLPSGLNATLSDIVRVPLEGEGLLAACRVPDLHRLVPLPLAMRLPSGLNATLRDTVWCAP